ncbi:helix-turn-helix transcriptional regulator [Streptomyces sp. NPDC000594]|uniref:helix-turn-helix domain-containing protein n=1 Tax=Streptomyces sp. NPDC000594 TaxID=3154261 RepID=UPI0033348937
MDSGDDTDDIPEETEETGGQAGEALRRELLRVKRERGLSLDAFAHDTPYSRSSWNRVLKGQAHPPREAVVRLCARLRLDGDRLLGLWEAADAERSGSAAAAPVPEVVPEIAEEVRPVPAGVAVPERTSPPRHFARRRRLIVTLAAALAAVLLVGGWYALSPSAGGTVTARPSPSPGSGSPSAAVPSSPSGSPPGSPPGSPSRSTPPRTEAGDRVPGRQGTTASARTGGAPPAEVTTRTAPPTKPPSPRPTPSAPPSAPSPTAPVTSAAPPASQGLTLPSRTTAPAVPCAQISQGTGKGTDKGKAKDRTKTKDKVRDKVRNKAKVKKKDCDRRPS